MGSLASEPDIYDIIIVGAGPCGLAVAARLHEPIPAAIFTDEEHRRFQWIHRHGRKMTLKNGRSGRISLPAAVSPALGENQQQKQRRYTMVVIDTDHEGWMGRWKSLFAAFEIEHLRSHMLFHVDPHDRDSLLARAVKEGREGELKEMKGCVGKEVSKHAKKRRARYVGTKQDAHVNINERDRNDYFNPSQNLFCDHCDDIVDRYSLRDGVVAKEALRDLNYGFVHGVSSTERDESLFTVVTDRGIRYARSVVLAVGPGNEPRIPDVPGMATPAASADTELADGKKQHQQTFPQTCHSMQITTFPDPIVKGRISGKRETNVLVIGGGLTAAQLADLAIQRGVTRVWLLTRGPLRVKHFDIGLSWMGKFRNSEQARFWLADSDEERLAMLRDARGGGSVTPGFYRRVKVLVAEGRLVLKEGTVLAGAKFEDGAVKGGGGAWLVKTDPPPHPSEEMPPMDYIYFATGVQTDFKTLPYLQTMTKRHPIQGFGGFPCLNDDLMWKDDVPLFFTGRLAALRLGPSAPNLGGARLGAERIAWAIEDMVAKSRGREGVTGLHDEENDEVLNYLAGRGSKYSSLYDHSRDE